MSLVFLDTSGLIAVVNADDQWHDRAETAWRSLIADQTELLTTSLVLNEVGDGLSRIRQRPLALRIHDRLRHSPKVEIVQVTADIEARAWQLFRERSDKEWGITDCVSFTIMAERNIEKAFTTDHHFDQAGFVRLLVPD